VVEAEGSKFVETVRLAAGDAGNRVEFSDVVDWRTLSAGSDYDVYRWEHVG
jgi:alpha-mannosidase